jgi:diguanylate cyclase (GGDEF)-like protein
MSELFDRIADLTSCRDRDVIDVTLVSAVRDMVQPRCVAIYRPVGEPGQECWSTRARLSEGERIASADPLGLDAGILPRLAAQPARHEALLAQRVVQVSGSPCRTMFPLVTERSVVGVLELETAQPLDAAGQRLVGAVLRIYRNFLGLLDYSERDGLTGLLNRKTFDESFLKATAQCAAIGEVPDAEARCGEVNHWLGVVDIDHFKRVNDIFGHLIGDEVLLLMARLLRSSFRTNDRVFRFGGEEFVVLIRCQHDADAALAFERLRENIAAYPFPQVGRITVSVGFSRVRANDAPSNAFARADQAVYHAKSQGRDRVYNHAQLVASGVLGAELPTGDVEFF